MKARPVMQRILERTEITDTGYETPCWMWTGGTNGKGYGSIGVGSRSDGPKRTRLIHQVTFEHYKGPIPEGLEPDHLCRVRRCWCPDHLEAVTHQENMRRAMRDECKHGHPFTPANTFVNRKGARVCLVCRRRQDAARYYRHRDRRNARRAARRQEAA